VGKVQSVYMYTRLFKSDAVVMLRWCTDWCTDWPFYIYFAKGADLRDVLRTFRFDIEQFLPFYYHTL
jgi:hypothetical protein